jgi:hypothetical protein
MSQRRAERERRSAKPARSPARPAPAPAPALSLAHPATLAAALTVAACIVVAVSIRIYDTDFWHHLLVGRVIWTWHAIPLLQIWNWSTYGSIDATNAWLFRVIVWPLWAAWGVTGLFVWRWLSTLAVFGIAWAAARRMGARGLTPLLVIGLCVLVYRARSQIRPETLVAVLTALQILVLETRRAARARGEALPALMRDPGLLLIAIAWVWANIHPSYYMGFVMIGFHVLDDLRLARWGKGPEGFGAAEDARRLVLLACAGLAISFVNPWTWRPLWAPFDFFIRLRHEPLYREIGELKPLDWHNNARNGLAALIVLWPLLAIWRWRRERFDLVEALCIAFFTALMLNTQRFAGTWSVVAAPYLARDLDAWVRTRRWPRWTRPAWARAGLVAVSCVALSIPEWSRVEYPLAIALDDARFPIAACDFMAAHGVRGRGFNDLGGAYQAWRFWPERARLPFITGTLETVTPEDRRLYTLAQQDAKAWRELDARHHFDYVLVSRYHTGWGALLDFLDADRATWALVFADDAAALYVRRAGPLGAVAERYGYRHVPAGVAGLAPLGQAASADSALLRTVEDELRRQARESRYNAQAYSLLARIAFTQGRLDDARRDTEASLAADPLTPGEHERLGIIALRQNRAADAVAEFRREQRLVLDPSMLDLRLGQSYAALGDAGRARGFLLRVLKHDPGNAEARQALASLPQ